MDSPKIYIGNFAFEQVPIELAKKAVEQDLKSANANFVPCVICGKPVELERCKTDENGKAVHEKCYLKAAAAKTAKRRMRQSD
jgi:hypothetical protein